MKSVRKRYADALKNRMYNGMVKVVMGIRSCGKPYLLFNLFRDFLRECGVEDDRIISIALDDDLNSALRNPDALSFVHPIESHGCTKEISALIIELVI